MPKGIYNHNIETCIKNLKKASIKNKGRKYSKSHRLAISKGVKESYKNNDKLRQLRKETLGKNRTPELYKKMVETRRKRGNYKVTDEQKIKESEAMKRLFDEHPEKHPNARMANRKYLNSQKRLFEYFKKIWPEAIMEYRITGTRRFADIAIPSLKIDIEFDGEFWHNKNEDNIRDLEIIKQGWRVFRYNKNFLKYHKI